ncbi:MAG TPA: FG-GAP-like repeat-containing protein [Candidatus Acidoferrales bacterium]|nr:FG-GAP-like repeat-containing protein [Candidatus Acidoferrales bacterium]
MDRHQFAEALGKFQTACVMNPKSDTGCLNMGIAFLNMRQFEDAQRVLAKSVERDPKNPRAWFSLGLLEIATGQPQNASPDFEKVAAIDPNDADTQYFIGYLASQRRQYDVAATAFQRAIAVDPFHISAEQGLSDAERRLGDVEDAETHQERAQQIVSARLGKPIRPGYGNEGKYSLAEEMNEPSEAASPAIPVRFVNVSSVVGLPFQPATGREIRRRAARGQHPPIPANDSEDVPETLAHFLGSGACVFDYDGDGRPDIFLANSDGRGHPALYRNAGKGRFVNVTKAAGLDFQGEGMGCAVGDYDNDGHPDLAVTSGDGIILFHNNGNGTFKDVTEEAGLRSTEPTAALALGVTFVDYDGDGDLDLYVTRFNNFPLPHPTQPFSFAEDAVPPGNVLWRNQGAGHFVDATNHLGLGGSAASVGALGINLRNDAIIDFVLAAWQKFPSVLVNGLDAKFHDTNPWAISMPGPAAGVAALDFDGDGWMDLAFTHWAPPGLTIWHNIGGRSFERLPLVGPDWMRGWGIAALDYDNDGLVDLVAVGETFSGEGRILLLRNEGAAGFHDVTHETGLDRVVLHNPRGVIPFDYNGDGAPDLLITQNNLPPILLKNVGGNKNNWLKIAALGDADSSMGIGARIEIFSGARRQTWQVSGTTGYLSQGPPEILAGLGMNSLADVVKLHWPSGLLQDEIQIPADVRSPIAETDRAENPR